MGISNDMLERLPEAGCGFELLATISDGKIEKANAKHRLNRLVNNADHW